ncbi:MAG: lipopolysaccharide transport periplasmic protein LptA [Pseudomonadales bacterium]|jgi:lipopolysaccharide export system protein LptA|nr:lipopolysaccharide transport periplasmic protein LptA [Pseudomonadales bacterium]
MSLDARALRALALILALAAPALRALPEDGEQPIEIESDRAELDEASGVAVYAGDVRMRQGTLVVTAETLTISTDDDAVTRITADGDGDDEPATFTQQIEAGPATDPDLQVRGRAAQIVYLTAEERIEFEGDAELSQATDRFEGDRISYDLRARRVNASAGGGERMTFTLDPARMRRREGERPEGR